MSEGAGIEPRTVATLSLTARCSNHLDRSHQQHLARSHPFKFKQKTKTFDCKTSNWTEKLLTAKPFNPRRRLEHRLCKRFCKSGAITSQFTKKSWLLLLSVQSFYAGVLTFEHFERWLDICNISLFHASSTVTLSHSYKPTLNVPPPPPLSGCCQLKLNQSQVLRTQKPNS